MVHVGRKSSVKSYLWIGTVALWAGTAVGFSSEHADAACPTENWTGTSAMNVKYDDADGVDENNTWFFLAGNDFGRSLACNDNHLYGDTGNDDLGGGAGDDRVDGEGGGDVILRGGNGDDILSGGVGNDIMQDQEGPATGSPSDFDIVFGDEDDDSIDVQDGDNGDLASGGPGQDECFIDHTSERDSCTSQ